MRQRAIAVYLVTYMCMLTYRLAEGNCSKPKGFFLHPDVAEDTYQDKAKVNYRCASDKKTITGGWWSTIICQTDKWSHTPACIDKKFCIPPEVPNAEIGEGYKRYSYESGSTVYVACKKGYQPQGYKPVTCDVLGEWTSLPVCERDKNAFCSAPPRVEYAAVVNRDYQHSFEEGTVVEYKCMESYEMSGSSRSTCQKAVWSPVGHCVPKPGSTIPPIIYDANPEDGAGRDTSTGRDVGKQDQECLLDPPHIINGDVVSKERNTATYQCANYFKLVGEKIIMCRDGRWDPPPECKPNYCKVEGKKRYLMALDYPKFINEGQSENFHCDGSWYQYYARGVCRNGEITFYGCGYTWKIPGDV